MKKIFFKNQCTRIALLFVMALAIMVSALFFSTALQVHAENKDFDVSIKNLSPSGSEYVDLQFTITNHGNNFEGTARLLMAETYSGVTAFDEDLTLPTDGTKQFTMTIPTDYINTIGATYFKLINSKGKTVYGGDFSKSIYSAAAFLSLGILSDNYNALTYFDLSGQNLSYGNDLYHINTVELNKTNLATELSSLTFLVIDNYNTSILSDDDILLINDWIMNGGVLVVGSGSYAENVFSDGIAFLTNTSVNNNQNNTYSDSYTFSNSGLTTADFSNSNYDYDDVYYLGSLFKNYYDGAIILCHYSFSELPGLTLDEMNGWALSEYATEILNRSLDYTSSGNRYYHYSNDSTNIFLPLVRSLNTKINLGVMIIVLVLYLIVISPLLYLFLKKKGKQEYYWISIPAFCVVFILLVYLCGNGLTVRKPIAYSVTYVDASGTNNAKGAIFCYDSHKKEWNLALKDTIYSICPQTDSYYYNNSYSMIQDANYKYHVGRSKGQLFLGMRPDSPFDECIFQFSGENHENGTLTYENGVISNRTGKDFAYVCILDNSSSGRFQFFENLPSGISMDIYASTELFSDTFSDTPEYELRNRFSNLMSPPAYTGDKGYKSPHAAAIPALSYGISEVQSGCPTNSLIIIGVVENYYPVIDDDCNETSYGCIYSIIPLGNGGNSNVIY